MQLFNILIAQENSISVRQLESNFNKVLGYAELHTVKPNLEIAKKALERCTIEKCCIFSSQRLYTFN